MEHHRLRVQDLARARGYNISTFARAAALAMNTSRNYWYGNVNQFDADVLERIAMTLHVTISDLFEPVPCDHDRAAPTRTPKGG